MLKLKTFRSRAKGLPDLLPYAALLAPDVVLTKDGTFLAVWDIRGDDTESSTDDELAGVSARVNAAIRRLGSEWMLHVDVVRQPATSYFPAHRCHFPDPVSRFLDEARRQSFASGRYFIGDTYLTVCYKPSALDLRLKQLSHKDHKATEKDLLQEGLATFQRSLVEIEDGLSSALDMARLTTVDKEDEHGTFQVSSLLTFLQTCLIGEEYPVRVPETPMYLDAILGGQDLLGGIAPRIGRKHMAVIAIDGLPSESRPSMLAFLSSLPFACRFSTRFICMDSFDALKEVDKYRKTWAQNIYKFFDKIFNKVNPRANRDAKNMAEDADNAYEALQSQLISAGYYTANMVILDEDLDSLQEKNRLVQRALMGIGFGCRLEEINALEAWLSTHPGNWYANVRRPIISTLNLADFLPLASVWTGNPENPCPMFPSHSPALIQCATDSTTPFWFNLHYGDIGHMSVIGPTGSGKSTFLAAIAHQFRKYPDASVIVFDKGMSMYPLCKAVGGQHYNIGAHDSPAFAPLAGVGANDPAVAEAESAWAREYIAMLCELQNLKVLPDHREAIDEAMQSLAQKAGEKHLTAFHQLVQNKDVKTALQFYTLRGGMGRVLDSKTTTLKSSKFTVFEIEEIMNTGLASLMPVLMYLFRTIERSLKGQPTLIILDEAWIMFQTEFFRNRIREWLKVMRKANCSVVLSTQSLSDLVKSEIMDVVIESCPKTVFLPNDKACEAVFVPMYKAFGLNDRQIEIIRDAIPKREYYVAAREGRRLVNLNLTPAELALFGASSKEHIARIKQLEAQHGNQWPPFWLRERGVKDVPDFWRVA